MTPTPRKVLVIFGTRPEAIKLAPVIQALKERPARFDCVVCCTGQHKEMVQQVIDAFGIPVDIRFDSMTASQTLGQLTGRLFKELDAVVEQVNPEWVIVQGDTTSAMVGATCAFYRKVKVGHVEAGLRTYDRWAPFPEEINRLFISRVTDLHFAPTQTAAQRLRDEGVPAGQVHVTGNTVVDALRWVDAHPGPGLSPKLGTEIQGLFDKYRVILVTSHRRESFGRALEAMCSAMSEIVGRYKDVAIVYPVHLNPSVREPVYRILGSEPRIKLIDPVEYFSLQHLLRASYLVLTDSGGIQEEAPSYGKPVLVMREKTERPEAIEAGCSQLVGTTAPRIVEAVGNLLDDEARYRSMVATENPFGDGTSGSRIVDILEKSAR